MSDLFGNLIVGFPMKRLIFYCLAVDLTILHQGMVLGWRQSSDICVHIDINSCLPFYAPNFEEVEGAYWFGSVRAVSLSVSPSVSPSVNLSVSL